MPSIENFKIAKSSRANAHSIKNERPNIKEICKSQFIRVIDVAEWITLLFGK